MLLFLFDHNYTHRAQDAHRSGRGDNPNPAIAKIMQITFFTQKPLFLFLVPYDKHGSGSRADCQTHSQDDPNNVGVLVFSATVCVCRCCNIFGVIAWVFRAARVIDRQQITANIALVIIVAVDVTLLLQDLTAAADLPMARSVVLIAFKSGMGMVLRQSDHISAIKAHLISIFRCRAAGSVRHNIISEIAILRQAQARMTGCIDKAPHLRRKAVVCQLAVAGAAVLAFRLCHTGSRTAAVRRFRPGDLRIADSTHLKMVRGIGSQLGCLMARCRHIAPRGQIGDLLLTCRVLVIFVAGFTVIISFLARFGTGRHS